MDKEKEFTMGFFTYLQDYVDKFFNPVDKNLIRLKSIFGDECSLCNNKIDFYHKIEVKCEKLPVCLLCRAKVENGAKWQNILKSSNINEKRKYYEKYLRIISLLSDCE